LFNYNYDPGGKFYCFELVGPTPHNFRSGQTIYVVSNTSGTIQVAKDNAGGTSATNFGVTSCCIPSHTTCKRRG
jgi:hypothetical protein